MSRGFPRSARVRRRREYLAVQRGGAKHHCAHFLVFVVMNEDLPTRIGITVTKKIGNAVARNRIKRRVREAFRHSRPRFPPGTQMVWVAKRGAAGIDTTSVRRDFETIIERLAPTERGSGAREDRT
jgi:ribonuclease P protein component